MQTPACAFRLHVDQRGLRPQAKGPSFRTEGNKEDKSTPLASVPSLPSVQNHNLRAAEQEIGE
jgi:hypothetical protein